MKYIVERLKELNLSIATMESCTGGGIANEITNVPGASEIIKFSAVTYCNEYKIKMGVDKKVIDKYSVYSIETAHEMAFNIHLFANSDIGIGVTGRLNGVDKENDAGIDNQVFVSIYYDEKYYDLVLNVKERTRRENKDVIIKNIISKLKEIIN